MSIIALASLFPCSSWVFLFFYFFNAFSSVFPTSSRTEVKQHVWQVAGSVAVDVAAAVAVVVVAVAVVVVVFSS